MTNGEKYEEEIVEILNSDKKLMCDDFVKKKVLASYGMICNHECSGCVILTNIWLSKEYKEPEVDWSKVKVDTPIYVQDCISDIWYPRYFAKFKDRQVYAWCDGKTSFTVGSDDAIPWAYAKLAKDNCNFKEEQE